MNISVLAEDYLIDVPIKIGTLSPQVKDPKEGMRKLTAGYLNEVMQVEAEKQIQARRYERTGKRKAHRNGTRPRSLKTILGEIELDKPKSVSSHSNKGIREIFSRGGICKSCCSGVVSRRSINQKSRESILPIRIGKYLGL